MIGVERRVGELVQAAREPEYLPVPFHAAHRGGCYASVAQLYETRDAARRQQGVGDLTLGRALDIDTIARN